MTRAIPLVSRELSSAEQKSLGDSGLSCSGAAQILRLTSNIYVPPNAVHYHSDQNVEYREYSVGIFPKVHLMTTNRLFSTLQNQRHDHIMLSHKGSAHPTPGVNKRLIRVKKRMGKHMGSFLRAT
jgi:hypothetical protein